VRHVTADRSLPLIHAEIIRESGIEVHCDRQLGVMDRRSKDEREVQWLRQSQQATEGAMRMACEMIAKADVRDGALFHEGEPLTSERVRAAIDIWLLERGYSNPSPVVAGGPAGADCHNIGSGPLFTRQPVIIDIFPQNRETRYHGDCTRTVVHGDISAQLHHMHAVVLEAKSAAIAATREGVTGQAVHEASIGVIRRHGFGTSLPEADTPADYCAMVHGTGHGIGLDVHEPPLLDMKGPPLIVGDALTIEPGLYAKSLGGIRVEDMVIVTDSGCENLNQLHEGLCWD